MRRVFLWAPPLVYMAVIFGVSSQPNPMPALTVHVWDKLLHSLEYGGLALLFCRALRGEGAGWAAAAVGAVLLTSGYGATDEYHQLFVPTRSSDVHDWIADTIGASAGAASYAAALSFGEVSTASRRPRPPRR